MFSTKYPTRPSERKAPPKEAKIPLREFAQEEDLCWITVSVVSDDGQEVTLFRGEQDMSNEWSDSIYFFSFEMMKIIELLESINTRLEEIGKSMG